MEQRLLALFKEGGDWEKELDKMAGDSELKRNLLSAAGEVVKKEGYLAEAVKIARHYQFDPDPASQDKFHEAILKGDEDVRYIVTVRGMLSWLLLDIVNKLEPEYFNDVLDILEGERIDTPDQKKLRLATGENLYIRQQATFPLELLATNIYAKQFPDGKPFEFDRERVKRIAFRMLDENKNVPRILEALAKVFNRFRRMNRDEAYGVLKTFLFKHDSQEKELNPDYVIHDIIPLLLFFAEFKKEHEPDFDTTLFQELLMRVIRESSPSIKGTLTWFLWKAVEEKESYYDQIKKYIPILLEPPFCGPVVNQFDFLIEKMTVSRPEEAIRLFDLLIAYMKSATAKEIYTDGWGAFLAYFENLLRFALRVAPQRFPGYLSEVSGLFQRGIYVGYLPNIIKLAQEAPAEYREVLAPIIENLKIQSKRINPTVSFDQ